jgi:hypothetical protein
VTFVTNAVLTLYILAAVAHPGKERARIEYDEYDAAEANLGTWYRKLQNEVEQWMTLPQGTRWLWVC